MRPNVFLPQEPMRREQGRWVSKGLNLAAATEYGDLQVVWGPDSSILSAELLYKEALAAAQRYDPSTDFIVALGSPTLIAMLAWAIGNMDKPLRMLEWDKGMQRYYPTIAQKGNHGNQG